MEPFVIGLLVFLKHAECLLKLKNIASLSVVLHR